MYSYADTYSYIRTYIHIHNIILTQTMSKLRTQQKVNESCTYIVNLPIANPMKMIRKYHLTQRSIDHEYDRISTLAIRTCSS